VGIVATLYNALMGVISKLTPEFDDSTA
jgi:hypothetical protein